MTKIEKVYIFQFGWKSGLSLKIVHKIISHKRNIEFYANC